MAEETWRIFSTRLTLSANASRVAVEARCKLSRAFSYFPVFEIGKDSEANFFVESSAAFVGGGGSTLVTGRETALMLSSEAARSVGACPSAIVCGSGSSVGCESAFPHSGQNIAGSRMDAPHEAQRGEIS